jgi:hypothetical protein
MKMIYRLMVGMLIGVFCIYPGIVAAQIDNIVAYWEMDVPPEEGWHIGDRIPLRLRVIAPGEAEVTFPELPEGWGSFEVSEQSVAEPDVIAGRVNSVLAITVQLWEVGIHETLPISVTLKIKGEEPREVEARPLRVEIVSVLPDDGDTAALEKRDLKPQAELPKPPLWPWFVGAACAAPFLYLGGRWLWYNFPRRKQHSLVGSVLEVIDTRYPEEIAYSCLEHIGLMDLPGVGAVKQHYSMVTDCIRVYLEGLYGLPAIDMTTTELKGALDKYQLDGEALGMLWELFDEADMVKFARLRPEIPQARSIVRWARHFVDVTKPQRHKVIDSDQGRNA